MSSLNSNRDGWSNFREISKKRKSICTSLCIVFIHAIQVLLHSILQKFMHLYFQRCMKLCWSFYVGNHISWAANHKNFFTIHQQKLIKPFIFFISSNYTYKYHYGHLAFNYNTYYTVSFIRVFLCSLFRIFCLKTFCVLTISVNSQLVYCRHWNNLPQYISLH